MKWRLAWVRACDLTRGKGIQAGLLNFEILRGSLIFGCQELGAIPTVQICQDGGEWVQKPEHWPGGSWPLRFHTFHITWVILVFECGHAIAFLGVGKRNRV